MTAGNVDWVHIYGGNITRGMAVNKTAKGTVSMATVHALASYDIKYQDLTCYITEQLDVSCSNQLEFTKNKSYYGSFSDCV